MQQNLDDLSEFRLTTKQRPDFESFRPMIRANTFACFDTAVFFESAQNA